MRRRRRRLGRVGVFWFDLAISPSVAMRWRGICFAAGLAGGGSDGGGGEDVVHAAGAVAFGVEGDVEEAQRLDGGSDFFEDGESEGAGEVVAGDFDSGEVAVVPDADLGEAECVKGRFGLLDLGEIFAGDRAAVLDARGEAGRGGLVGE